MISYTFTCNLCNEHYSANADKRLLGFEHRTLTQGRLNDVSCHICISCLQALKNDLTKFDTWLKGSFTPDKRNYSDEEASKILGVNELGVSVGAYETWRSDQDAITWAMSQGVFSSGIHATNSFNKMKKELLTKELKVIYEYWYHKVLDKIRKQPA